MERFAREDLPFLLELRFRDEKIIFSEKDKMYFFGEYATDPNQFQFSDGEKKMILLLMSHAKQSFDVDDISNTFEEMSLHQNRIKSSSHWYFNDESQTAPSDDIVFEQVKPQNIEQNIPQTHTHRILKKLLETVNQNASRPKAGRRYDPEVKRWAAFLRMLSGPTAYNTLQKNLELALPSLSRINYFVQNTHNTFIEGVLRCEELLLYLQENNLPLSVCISEDATRIVGRVQYNSKKNQLIGFVLPLNQNGIPTPFAYSAKNTDEIVRHFTSDTDVSNSIITVMAQPIAKVPPFCLLFYGTNNKFNGEDVSKRWNYINKKLKELNIIVLTASSDSALKYNSAMKKNSGLGRKSNLFDDAHWFKCGHNKGPPFYVQDETHIGTKLRNLLFRTIHDPMKLRFGKYYIQLAHLQRIVNEVPKDQHELTQTTLDWTDRQNFNSVLRICDSRVLALLKKHVKGSDGTIKFLEIVKKNLDAYMEFSLNPLDRVSKLWYSIFFVRAWRLYVLDQKFLTLKDNFLTSACYSCMELNAHSMILILLYLKSTNQSHLFLPWLYSSQPCEGFYRQIRALSTCNSTVTNCTVKEIADRIHKIELQNEISSDPTTSFIFPHKLKSNVKWPTIHFKLPTEQEIFDTIEKCQVKAISDAIKIGLIDRKYRKQNIDCNIPRYFQKKSSPDYTEYDEQFPEFDDEEGQFEVWLDVLNQLKTVNLKNFAYKFGDGPVCDTSPYTEIYGGKKRIVIKKESLVWLIRKNEKKLSSDRLQRVKARVRVDEAKPSMRKKKLKKCEKYNNQKIKVKYFPKGYVSGEFNKHKRSKKNKHKHLSQ